MEVSRGTSDNAHVPDRLLMTADAVGGVWTYALELSRALPDEVEVALATMGDSLSPHQQRAATRLPNVNVFESDYKLEWMQDPWADVEAAGAWLLDLEERFQPDLVHLNNYAHGSLPWQVPTLVVGHSCVYSWFNALKDEAPPDKWQRYRDVVTLGLQQADLVAAPTEAMLAALKRHYGAFGKGHVVYNGRKADTFPPQTKAPFILAAGRLWDDAKNVAALDQVAPRLEWPVRVAGARQYPNGEPVEFDGVEALGWLDSENLADQLGRASIFALPARYEPFGLSALEAGLSGCALVLGDIPSQREVWGEDALFVPPDDPEALHKVLQQLIEDEDLRKRMGRSARRRALTYTPARMAQEYLDLYARLLGSPEEAVRREKVAHNA